MNRSNSASSIRVARGESRIGSSSPAEMSAHTVRTEQSRRLATSGIFSRRVCSRRARARILVSFRHGAEARTCHPKGRQVTNNSLGARPSIPSPFTRRRYTRNGFSICWPRPFVLSASCPAIGGVRTGESTRPRQRCSGWGRLRGRSTTSAPASSAALGAAGLGYAAANDLRLRAR